MAHPEPSLVQQQLPKARVVKAFNTVLAMNQDKGEVDGMQLDGFFAGDEAGRCHPLGDRVPADRRRSSRDGALPGSDGLPQLRAQRQQRVDFSVPAGSSWDPPASQLSGPGVIVALRRLPVGDHGGRPGGRDDEDAGGALLHHGCEDTSLQGAIFVGTRPHCSCLAPR